MGTQVGFAGFAPLALECEMIPIDDAVTFFRLVVHMRRYLEVLTEIDIPRYGVRLDDEHCLEFRYCWQVLNSQN